MLIFTKSYPIVLIFVLVNRRTNVEKFQNMLLIYLLYSNVYLYVYLIIKYGKVFKITFFFFFGIAPGGRESLVNYYLPQNNILNTTS